MNYTPSPEQAAYRAALQQDNRSIILEAVAGSGKTTTLVDNLDVLKGSTALMAFNKKIAEELKERIAKQPSMVQLSVQAGTAHSFGFSCYRKLHRSPRVQGGKLNFLLKDMFSYGDRLYPARSQIRQLVSLAKQTGFGLQQTSKFDHFPTLNDSYAWLALAEHHDLELDLEPLGIELEEIIKPAQTILQQSNAQEAMIDFDDMIYLPLLKQLEFPKFDNVLIDEAQDTNVVRREMAFRMLKNSGRIIAVGDRHQAIYGFTGADAAALDNIKRRADAIELPLSVCWRCDQKVIEHAQRWVKHIKSYDTEGRGSVTSIPFDEHFLTQLLPGDAILCRLNKPNVSVAIALLRRGRSARIEGRDLGTKLLSHARKAAPDLPPLDELQLALEPYLQHQQQLLMAAEKHTAAALLEDEVDALHILIERCLEQGKKDYTALDNLCAELFVDDAHKGRCIVLSSIHKAKGLEWPRVYLLGRDDYQPFFRAAEGTWQYDQEINLIYVAVTRAKHELIEVVGVKSALDKGVHRQVPAATKEPSNA